MQRAVQHSIMKTCTKHKINDSQRTKPDNGLQSAKPEHERRWRSETLHYCMLMWQLRVWGGMRCGLISKASCSRLSKGEKTKGLIAANAVIICNYSITALPFWDLKRQPLTLIHCHDPLTVYNKWRYSDYISNFIFGCLRPGKLSTTATVVQHSQMRSLFWGIYINITQNDTTF